MLVMKKLSQIQNHYLVEQGTNIMEIKGDAKEIADLLKLAGMDSGAPEVELDKVDADDEMPMDNCSCDDTMDFLDVPVEVDDEAEVEEADLNNGYDEHHFADPEDYFPNGHTGPVDDEAGPASAKHGDNPLHKAMKEDEMDDSSIFRIEMSFDELRGDDRIHNALNSLEAKFGSLSKVASHIYSNYSDDLFDVDGVQMHTVADALMHMASKSRVSESIHKDLVYKYREFKKK